MVAVMVVVVRKVVVMVCLRVLVFSTLAIFVFMIRFMIFPRSDITSNLTERLALGSLREDGGEQDRQR